MKEKRLVLEHSSMMYSSQELMLLQMPVEINVMMYSVFALFIAVFVALGTVRINDVKKVSGIIRTKENVSSVRNVTAGKIEGIFYSPGMYVHKGDVLLVLDGEILESTERKIEIEMDRLKNQIWCSEKIIESIEDGKDTVLKDENLICYSQIEEYLKTLAYYEEMVGICKYRLQKEMELPEIMFNRQNFEEAKRNLQLSQKELEKYRAEVFSRTVLSKNECEKEVEKLVQDLNRTAEEKSFLEIRAPVDGFVQEISSLNKGDYIFANQDVLNIVPSGEQNFRVEMNVPAKDIGELVSGMTVKYRLSAFPFFEYKGAQGEIFSIDSDARKNTDGRLFYQVFGDIDRVIFSNAKGDEYPLRAGVEVDARIVMEKITLLHFVLRKLNFVR